MSNKENCKFQTEISELLNLIINSLYSNPEIFLRELISNASDALDKLKLESATNESLLPQGYTPEIFITIDPDKNTISISDNGIGMTLDEVKENIGTIAHSGTKKFMQIKDELKDNPSLIGQFGVGFYSAFIVADKVCLETKKAGTDKAVRWESDGKSEYTIEEIDKDSIGTTVTLYLKDKNNEENQDLADFTKEWKIKDIVKKHSDFIAYPIKMECEKFVPQSKEDEEAG
ncbi:MAG: ATP-binding protein, partial [Pseudomonadota bacterium]|nr:ATP-binding protein [Pseudomonadota bacterium]